MEEEQSWSDRHRSEFEEASKRLSDPKSWESPIASSLDFVRMLSATFALVSGGSGECRVVTPYAPIRPVIDQDGNLRWCCTHDPEHCATQG